MRDKNAVALTPPMGWNSWDVYGPSVNEEQLLGNAQYMADHLKEFGWEYVVCDIQWSEPNAGQQPLLDYVPSDYVPFAWITMDEYGRQLPAVERFPSAAGGKGFGPIAEKIHSMGLKFGIHIMRGVPRLAVHQHHLRQNRFQPVHLLVEHGYVRSGRRPGRRPGLVRLHF